MAERPFISPDFVLIWNPVLAILPLIVVAMVLAATWSSLRRTISMLALLALACGALFVALYVALIFLDAPHTDQEVVNSVPLLSLTVLFAMFIAAGSVGWVLALWCCTWRHQRIWFVVLLLSGILAVIAVPLVSGSSAFFSLAPYLPLGDNADLYLVLVGAFALQNPAWTLAYGFLGAPRQHPTVTAKVK